MKGCFLKLVTTCFLYLLPLFVAVGQEKLAYIIKFNDYETGSVEDWLQGKGFDFKQDAQKRNLIDLNVSDNGLIIEAKRRAFGIMLNEAVNAAEFTSIEIDWGSASFHKVPPTNRVCVMKH